MFLSGLPLIIGPTRTFYFFSRKEKWRGTICFFIGIALVFAKWPLTGILLELVGFIGLFGCVRFDTTHAARSSPLYSRHCASCRSSARSSLSHTCGR